MTDQTHCRELLPCPFCGSGSHIIFYKEDSLNFAVMCQYTSEHGCGMRGPYRRTEESAIEAWNTRAQASAPEGGEKFDAWWNRNGDGSMYGRGIALEAWNEMSMRNKSKLDFKQTVIDQAMARIKELEGNAGSPVAVRYFAADPAEGEFDTFATLDEAKSKAEQLLEWSSDAAYEDGWADEPPQICYGIVIAGCEEEPGSRKPAPEGSDFTEMVSFRLTDPTYTRSNAKAGGVDSDFVSWLQREMPAGTVIGDPAWWAKRIAGRLHFMKAAGKEPDRYVVLKAVGSRYAYVNDTHEGKTVKRYDIFNRDGWQRAVEHAKRLNDATQRGDASEMGVES